MSLRVEIIPVTAFEQNCSLVWDTDTMKGALVDAGGEIDHLLSRVEHHGITLEKLLVTHGHLDHASAVQDLADRLGLPDPTSGRLQAMRTAAYDDNAPQIDPASNPLR